jgi:hypothetical protein
VGGARQHAGGDGLAVDKREVIISSVGSARPEARESSPQAAGLGRVRRPHLHRLDFHALGGGLGRSSDCCRVDGLVLAKGDKEDQ